MTSTIIAILTSLFLGFLLFGLLVGFGRGWVRSLIRFGIIIVSILFAVFLSPALTGKLLDKFVSGTTFSGFGISIDLEEKLSEVAGASEFLSDLFASDGTTTDLAVALLNVLMNILAFLLIFLVIVLVSLIIYWIVCLCIHVKRKKAGIKPEKTASYWWLKVLGGGIGILSSVAISFVLLTPVFGVMNVCDKFLQTAQTEESASAVGLNNYLCGELYYTEDENIGQVEGYIQKYANIKEEYNDSFIGKFFNATGISKLGKTTFNYLTNVNSNGLEVNVTNEIVALINTYNIYKKHFVENTFDLANNDSLDGVMEIYELANESEIVKSYIEEFVPKFAEKWTKGEKFLGISLPVSDEFEPLAQEVLKIFTTTNSTRIKANVKAVVGAIQVANNNEIITSVRDGQNLMEILSNNHTFVKEEILQLSSTNEFKQALPQIMNKFIELAYDEIVAGDAVFEDIALTNQEIDAIVWNDEATALQGLVDNVLIVYNTISKSSDEDVMLDQLTNVGNAIDCARDSAMVSQPFKVFIIDFIKTDMVNLEADVKETIIDSINEHWDDETYSYAVTLNAIEQTAKIAQNILNGTGSVDLGELSGVLYEIISDENAKGTINNLLSSDIVTDLVGSSEVSGALVDMLDTLVNDPETEQELDDAISAGQEIVNIINNSEKNNGNLVLDGETEEEKKANAEQILENIASSDIVMGLLNESASTEGSALGSLAGGLGGDGEILKDAIDSANISAEDKEILSKLFS